MKPTQGVTLRGGGNITSALSFDSVSSLFNYWNIQARRDKSIDHAQVLKKLIFVQEEEYLVRML